MTAQSHTVLETATAQALAAEFHRCCSDFTARDDLFASPSRRRGTDDPALTGPLTSAPRI